MTRSRSLCLGALTLLALVGCDHVTKHVAKADLQGRPPKPVIGLPAAPILDLRYVENTDVAFNLMHFIPAPTRAPLLLGSGLLGCATLLVLVARRPRRPVMQAGLLLVTAGALGNTLDRVARGYVVDFIHVPHWPVFNVADMCVTAGAALMVWAMLRQSAQPTAT